MKTFAKRVNTELKKRIVEVKEANPVFELKGVNVARKGYLDARAEKKRRRKAGLPAEMIMPEAEEEAPPAAAAGAGVRAASSGGGGKTGAITAGAVDTSVQLAGHKRPRPRYEADDGTDERDFTCDHVAFGERAERPPTFTAQPRKSKVRAHVLVSVFVCVCAVGCGIPSSTCRTAVLSAQLRVGSCYCSRT